MSFFAFFEQKRTFFMHNFRRIGMKILEERIIKDGTVIGDEVLKVDSFLTKTTGKK